jgi:hypothetical protein
VTKNDQRVCELTVDLHPRTVHIESGITALTARATNLHWTCDALTAADIPYFLVPGMADLASAVGILECHRENATKAISEIFEQKPGYISTATPEPRTPALPVPGDRQSSWDNYGNAEVLRLTWFRADPTHSLVFGQDTSCDVEFWVEDEGVWRSPRMNRVARAVDGHGSTAQVNAHRFTRLASRCAGSEPELDTHADFVYDQADDVTFPVDVVYTWVDGSDPAWLTRRAAVSEDSSEVESTRAARFLSRDELRFSLRSLHANAPWVRNVFIVTDDQQPPWLRDDVPGVRVVSHREIFRDQSVLPTYNSHAIESQLHHIDGLSEHFVYLNDDMFIGRPVPPQAFFLANGLSQIFLSKARVPIGGVTEADTPISAACKNNRALLESVFGRTITQTFQHTPYALHRSILQDIEDRFPQEHARTAASRFRGRTDLSIASSLHHYYALFTGRAVPGSLRYSYTHLAVPDLRERLARILNRRDYDTFCINDAFSSEGELEGQAAVLVPFLERYFPVPHPAERA